MAYKNSVVILIIMFVFILYIVVKVASAETESNNIKLLIFQQSCHVGVVEAVNVLPSVPDRDAMLSRGYASCAGAVKRLSNSGELAKEKNLLEFSCGYAVGAMFAKYGLSAEISKPSKRMLNAVNNCLAQLKKQGVKNPE